MRIRTGLNLCKKYSFVSPSVSCFSPLSTEAGVPGFRGGDLLGGNEKHPLSSQNLGSMTIRLDGRLRMQYPAGYRIYEKMQVLWNLPKEVGQ